jgi:hypothetical protein
MGMDAISPGDLAAPMPLWERFADRSGGKTEVSLTPRLKEP